MKKLIATLTTVGAVVLSSAACYAGFDASICFSGCSREHSACMAKIDALNDVELKDQTAACDRAKSECFNGCDAERENDLREMRERMRLQGSDGTQPPEAQEPPQEPPQDQPQDQPQEQQ